MKKYICFISIIVSVLILLSGCGAKSTSAKSIEEGKLALAGSKYDEAKKFFKLAVDNDKNNDEADSYYKLVSDYMDAESSLEKEDYEKCKELISEIKLNLKYDSIKDDVEQLEKKIENGKTKDETSNKNTDNVVMHSEDSLKNVEYLNYSNERYKFTIQYPYNMVSDGNADNNDGTVFNDADNNASLQVYGNNNILSKTLEEAYKDELQNLGKDPEYKQLLSDSYVISWKEDNNIFYKCCAVGEGSMNTFILKYPESDKSLYEGIVEKVYSSFKTPGINESY